VNGGCFLGALRVKWKTWFDSDFHFYSGKQLAAESE
jgi:hypothetical protein